MKFGTVAIAEAEGAILAHSVSIGSRRLAKGTRISAADITAAAAAGVGEVAAARLETGDIHEDDAATAVADALCGPGLRADPAAHGRANIVAAAAGLLMVDQGMVAALNAVDEAVTLATLLPFAPLRAGDIAATVKLITFAAPAPIVAAGLEIAGRAPLRVAHFVPRRVRLIQTALPATSSKLLAKTAEVTRARIEALGPGHWEEKQVAHEVAALAEAIGAPGADLVLVAGASATTDRRDVIPAAIEAIGGVVVRLGMPVEPGNLLCLGRIGQVDVVGMPGCARSPKRNGFDWVIERLFAGLTLSGGDIAAMGVGGLLADVARPEPRRRRRKSTLPVGVLVLAAGRSVRMGSNKLLADLGGRPVLGHVLQAVSDTRLPAIVVTGHAAPEVAALAAAHGFRSVHAERFAEGLSQSLAAGIRSVQTAWGAVIVVLGDMPEVGAAEIEAVASAAREDAVAVPTFDGKRGNPVAWGRQFFAQLAQLEGDVGGKALLAEHAGAVVEVPIERDGILFDVDTPEALAAAISRHSRRR